MSKAFESIKNGLSEALEYSKGRLNKGGKIHRIQRLNVKAIRKKVGLTQIEFASSFGISLGTLRHWERGDRSPRGPARVLLKVVDKSPETVLRVANEVL